MAGVNERSQEAVVAAIEPPVGPEGTTWYEVPAYGWSFNAFGEGVISASRAEASATPSAYSLLPADAPGYALSAGDGTIVGNIGGAGAVDAFPDQDLELIGQSSVPTTDGLVVEQVYDDGSFGAEEGYAYLLYETPTAPAELVHTVDVGGGPLDDFDATKVGDGPSRFFYSGNSAVTARDPVTGDLDWEYTTNGPSVVAFAVTNRFSVALDANDDAALLNETGSVIEETSAPSYIPFDEIEGLTVPDSSSADNRFIIRDGGTIRDLNEQDLSTSDWSFDIQTETGIEFVEAMVDAAEIGTTAAGGRSAVAINATGSGPGAVVAVESDGSVPWVYTTADDTTVTGVASANGGDSLVIAEDTGDVFAVDSEDGSEDVEVTNEYISNGDQWVIKP